MGAMDYADFERLGLFSSGTRGVSTAQPLSKSGTRAAQFKHHGLRTATPIRCTSIPCKTPLPGSGELPTEVCARTRPKAESEEDIVLWGGRRSAGLADLWGGQGPAPSQLEGLLEGAARQLEEAISSVDVGDVPISA